MLDLTDLSEQVLRQGGFTHQDIRHEQVGPVVLERCPIQP